MTTKSFIESNPARITARSPAVPKEIRLSRRIRNLIPRVDIMLTKSRIGQNSVEYIHFPVLLFDCTHDLAQCVCIVIPFDPIFNLLVQFFVARQGHRPYLADVLGHWVTHCGTLKYCVSYEKLKLKKKNFEIK